MTNILFAARSEKWEDYEVPLRSALDAEGLDYRLDTNLPADEVDYIVYAPNSDVQDFTPFTRLKAVLNLWAGVEGIVGNETLTVPLTRMVDEHGLTQGMVEWVTGHTLRHHLGMDAHIVNPDRKWDTTPPPLSADRPVTILGMGALGQACASALTALGFPVTGWSRTPKDLPGVTCHAGEDGLRKALTGAQIVILLLPDTPATLNLIDAETLAMPARGACLINPGRGPLIDDEALIAALDAGQIAHATLDVFRVEPLPEDHAFWSHPRVTVTPHIASITRPGTAARVIAENIRRGETGDPLLHLVDRDAGY
ncbi:MULTISPECIES: glyoxylate/hydroxypyruvate reductase A [unclassified Mameliella]|uniref:2-hydroxyacid dehydrogenase n=1 Tax=unclassified Mameliella TaxID=2630630 RepID=UPI00273FAE87|nr:MULTISPECIES: glyoxylate/hydroxypyruvate reductase A [unclassified Mameliella]